MSGATPSRRARRIGALVATLFVALIGVGLTSPAAFAASTHPFQEEWSPGPNCNPRDVATDPSGNVIVACGAMGANELLGSIRKFSPTGVPMAFQATAPHISGNEINRAPLGSHLGRTYIDVDRSNSVRSGYIYVSSVSGGTPGSNNVEIFAPTGAYVTSIKPEVLEGSPTGVGIDDEGFIYVLFEECCGKSHIKKIDPQSFQEIDRISITITALPLDTLFHGPCCVRIDPDTSGAVWTEWGNSFFDGAGEVSKYEADQFGTSLTKDVEPSPFLEAAFEEEIECPKAERNGFGGGEHDCALQGETFDVDWATDDLYLNAGSQIVPYSKGEPGDPVHQNGPSFGLGKLSGSQGVDVDKDGNVYAGSAENKILKFARGATLPLVTTKPRVISDIGHTTAKVHGVIDPDGGGEITNCQVAFGTTKSYAHPDSPVPCVEATPFPAGSITNVTANLPNLEVGVTYNYRFEASNANGSNIGGNRRVEAKAVLNLETKAAEVIDENNVILNGQLDADGLATTYHYEYGRTDDYGQTTPVNPINGAPGEVKTTAQPLGHLQRGKVYHYRLVATNSLGTTKGDDMVFRTASPPEIAGVGSENVLETSADLHATINPVGYDTTYKFHFGPTVDYGRSLPATEITLTGNEPEEVSVHLEDLPPGSTIHYKVVATNEWGTSETDDTTFNFRPPSCPNAHVRQLTGANYLPDCRAYEIVSPGYAGAVQLLPGEALETFAETFGGSEFPQSPQNLGYTNGRFVYWGALGSVLGLDAPNSLLDVYLSTRTEDGWKTTLPGLKGRETKTAWGRGCSYSLDKCVDHQGTAIGAEQQIRASQSPFLYEADGTRLGRLPTNVDVVKGGTDFRGDQRLSGDFSNYVFSTQTKFTPDGLDTAPGSVYDNALGPKTVEVISKLQNEEPIPVQPSVAGDPTRITGIAGVSEDGSRILMAGTTNAFCDSKNFPFKCPWILKDPARLYMRVNNALTYDVSRGEEVLFAGMTLDASKVYFTTPADLDPADSDTSSDLYLWEEQGDKLTLISQNGTLGTTDDCSAGWTSNCGVQPLTPLRGQWSEFFDKRAMVPGSDDILANQSGDIYFYSPEDLVPGEIGGDGERNLYLWRGGELQYVTTFDPGTQVERSTISQDGRHAAFLTKSSLTAFDADGRVQVYSYDADRDAMRCASCNPAGTVPVDDVVSVSESGPFMANDGRTFFATTESLTPQDTNGLRDIYEYTEGRAQLISSGTGDRDNTGGLEVISIFFGKLNTGLESVSRDGVNVFFSTFETLVPEDQNGSFLKMYNARAGGGFDFNPDLGDCQAADECHGDVTRAPAPPAIATAATLGPSGNVAAPTKKSKRKARKNRRRARRRARNRKRARKARNARHSRQRQGSGRNG